MNSASFLRAGRRRCLFPRRTKSSSRQSANFPLTRSSCFRPGRALWPPTVAACSIDWIRKNSTWRSETSRKKSHWPRRFLPRTRVLPRRRQSPRNRSQLRQHLPHRQRKRSLFQALNSLTILVRSKQFPCGIYIRSITRSPAMNSQFFRTARSTFFEGQRTAISFMLRSKWRSILTRA